MPITHDGGKLSRRTRWIAAVTLSSILTASLTGAAVAPNGMNPPRSFVPTFVGGDSLIAGSVDGMSRLATEGLALFERSSISDSVQGYEWDAGRGLLVLHVEDGRAVDLSAIGASFPTVKWEVVRDRFPASWLRSAADTVARAQEVGGATISWAGASVDGSHLTVAIVGQDRDIDGKAVVEAIGDLIGDEIPVDLRVEESVATLADRQYHTQPYIGGALISTRSGGYLSTCSSGFAIVQNGVPSSRTAMLTADHCGASGTSWMSGKYTDSPYFGTGQSTSSGGADLP